MPYSEAFNGEKAFTIMRKKAACPFAGGKILPNYSAIRHEQFHDRPFAGAGVGAFAGSHEDFEVGGASALVEGASHIPFFTKHRGGKEAMRNPYNTFKEPMFSSATVGDTNYHRAPDAMTNLGRPCGVGMGKERFVGRSVGRLYGAPQNVGSLPIGIHYT